MSEYAARARYRWARGVAEIRGGEHRPFVGDPIDEGIEEVLDLRNYADEGRRQLRISAIERAVVVACGWVAFRILRRAQR